MKSVSLTEVLSDLRHDLKSPLVGMKALIFTARRRLEKGQVDQAGETLASLDKRIDSMVTAIDEYSRKVEEVLPGK